MDTDKLIIDRILGGDQDAYAVLVDRYKGRMYSIAYGKIGDTAVVEDIVQQAFIDAYEKLGILRDRNHFGSWLSQITSHKCYHWHTKERRQNGYIGQYQDEISRQQTAKPAPTPEMLLITQEMQSQILGVIKKLAPKYREVAVLRFMEDLSYREIADHLEVPMSTVIGRLKMARDQLYTSLNPVIGEVLKGLLPGPEFTNNVLKVTTLPVGNQKCADGSEDKTVLMYPRYIIVDPSENFYLSDLSRIYKIDKKGMIKIVLDGRRGIWEAEHFSPTSLAFDSKGNLYICDTWNHRIIKRSPNDLVSVFAGTGAPGLSDGTRHLAKFNHPFGIAVDHRDHIYVTDTENNRIRKIMPDGYVVTIAGNGSGKPSLIDGPADKARFNNPSGIVVDSYGTLYIADHFNHCIRKMDPTGYVSTIIGRYDDPGFIDGPADVARLSWPSSLTMDSNGTIYVVDSGRYTMQGKYLGGSNSIRKVYMKDGVYHIETLAGGTRGFSDGYGMNAQFHFPHGILLDHDNQLIICDTANNRIRQMPSRSM